MTRQRFYNRTHDDHDDCPMNGEYRTLAVILRSTESEETGPDKEEDMLGIGVLVDGEFIVTVSMGLRTPECQSATLKLSDDSVVALHAELGKLIDAWIDKPNRDHAQVSYPLPSP